MGGSKLLEVINALTNAEKGRLKDFLASPYYNKNEKLIVLYNGILKGEDPPKIGAKVFHDKEFNPRSLRSLRSKLYMKIGEFLFFDRQKKNIEQVEVAKFMEFVCRDLKKSIPFSLNKAERILAEHQQRDHLHYWLRYEFEFGKLVNSAKNTPRKKSLSSLERANDYLDIHYLINKLRLISTQLSHKNIFLGPSVDGLALQSVLDLCEKYIDQAPALEIYYHLVLLYDSHDKRSLNLLLDLLPETRKCFSTQEAFDIFLLIHNWLTPAANENDDDALKLFELLEFGFEENWIQPYGKMVTASLAKNFIRLAMRLGKDERSFALMEQSINKLPEQMRSNIINFKEAHLKFRLGDYQGSKVYLNLISHKDLFFALSARVLFIKICYCEQEYDILDSSLQSLMMFIRRQRNLTRKHKERCQDFIRYTRQLMNPNDKSLKEMRRKISEEAVHEKAWLLEIISNY